MVRSAPTAGEVRSEDHVPPGDRWNGHGGGGRGGAQLGRRGAAVGGHGDHARADGPRGARALPQVGGDRGQHPRRPAAAGSPQRYSVGGECREDSSVQGVDYNTGMLDNFSPCGRHTNTYFSSFPSSSWVSSRGSGLRTSRTPSPSTATASTATASREGRRPRGEEPRQK